MNWYYSQHKGYIMLFWVWSNYFKYGELDTNDLLIHYKTYTPQRHD